jgi:hypothetical protein
VFSKVTYIQASDPPDERQVEAGSVEGDDDLNTFEGLGDPQVSHLIAGELDHLPARDVNPDNADLVVEGRFDV